MEERFSYDQVICRNESFSVRERPRGRIRVDVPYDGGACFGADARADAELHLDDGATTSNAVFGHLVFVEHEETDLGDVLGFTGTSGRHALRMPIRSRELFDAETLSTDRFSYGTEIGYRSLSGGPKPVSLKVSVELFDPGHQDGSFLEKSVIDLVRRQPELRRTVAEHIKESAEFEPYLTARVGVRLSLPPHRVSDTAVSMSPVVRSIRVTLPEEATIPLSTVRLFNTDGHRIEQTVQTDTRAGSFEWIGGPMSVGMTENDAPRVYTLAPVDIQFQQPGELFRQREITVEVEVELPNELLSGAQVRYFDAIGEAPRRGAATPLTVRTILTSHCTVLLYDAFMLRKISPSQSFCFDEIVPDPSRVDDVAAALTDQRFTVELKEALPGGGKKRVEHLIIATRRDGPRTMQLWIFVEGRRHPTERESRHPWGHRYRSKFESGSLKVHVRGLVHGDARGVTREITTMHLALHDRFLRMKALR